MLFLAGQSTSAYLWLFGFLSFGCAQDDSENSSTNDAATPTFSPPFLTTPIPTVNPEDIRRRRSSSADNDSCPIPPDPAHGARSLYYCGSATGDCDIYNDVGLAPGTLLEYTCHPGYNIRGNPLVLCVGEGNLSPIPVCTAVICDPLNSTTTTAECFRSGEWVDCDSSFLEGSWARISCRPGYSPAMSNPKIQDNVQCNRDGKWVPDPMECVPTCGVAPSGTTTGFPWHASVYSNSGVTEISHVCEGTLIRNNLVLTAGGCVWDEYRSDPRKVFVMTGHSFQKWNHSLHDLKVVRKSMVKDIHMNCEYLGDQRREGGPGDIALIELKEPLEFSSTLVPACLDEYRSKDKEVFEPDAYGKIAEFRYSRFVPNNIVSVKTIPYVSYSQCKSLDDRSSRHQQLTSDKFCAGYLNGSTDCVYNRGSGLVVKKNNLWHVMGVMSDIVEGCGPPYTLFTNVSKYTVWIQQVMFNLQHYKSYPPCDHESLSYRVTTTTETPTNHQTLSNYEGPSCLTPPQPTNGEWKYNESLCPGEENCDILQGTPLRPGARLIYSCASGYMAEGSTVIYCGSNGDWSDIPLCTEIKCDSLNSVSTIASCYDRFDKLVSCDFPVPPGTKAEISCHLGYRKDTAFSTVRRETVTCSKTGEWTPDPIRCVPDCGVANTQQKPFISNGTSARISDFPWHATLYMQKNSSNGARKEFICGATIIQTNFLLTAAHCIYDETDKATVDPARLFVMTGNIFREYDSPFHNPLSIRKSEVKNVYRPCKYYGLRGNYVSDIALLELQTPFTFSSILLPACLDVAGYSDQILEPGVSGRVAGFGRTATGESSGILQTLSLPYISYSQCKTSKNAEKNDVFISKDKFCAGHTNGSAVCEGDSGGGLVFKKRELWYVLGIVSVGLGVDIENGEKTCDRYAYSLYTKVSEYMIWIQDVMFQRAQRIPYPLCDADV